MTRRRDLLWGHGTPRAWCPGVTASRWRALPSQVWSGYVDEPAFETRSCPLCRSTVAMESLSPRLVPVAAEGDE